MLTNEQSVVIQTTTPEIKLGEILLSADKRSTKDEKLTDAERIRKAVLPANFWGEVKATHNDQASQGLTDILREQLKKLASDLLRDKLAENPQLRQIALTEFSIPNLLRWSEETASSRGSITFTREQVESWFKASATRSNLATKHSSNPKLAALLDMVSNRFGALAAKNHGLKDAADASKLLSIIATEDMDTPLVTDIVGRIAHIEKTLLAKEQEATVSMDDL